MQREFAIALRATLVTLVLTGLLYPLAVTGLAQLLLPARRTAACVTDEHGQVVGSALIGQALHQARATSSRDPRPPARTATTRRRRAARTSAPTSQKLHDRAAADVERLRAENPDATGAGAGRARRRPRPAGSIRTSRPRPRSGRFRACASARSVEPERVRAVDREPGRGPRTLGFLGEPRVNVLLLNLALDRQFGRRAAE